uniref:Uncharacterized protein n=1 Tax=Anguilla anguilla TaxID=7936 RepID=A0A0E9TVW4_ANGAN
MRLLTQSVLFSTGTMIPLLCRLVSSSLSGL